MGLLIYELICPTCLYVCSNVHTVQFIVDLDVQSLPEEPFSEIGSDGLSFS